MYFKHSFPGNSGSVCGLSTAVACKLGLSTVGVFQTRFQVNSGSVCGLSTVVAWKLGLLTVGPVVVVAPPPGPVP